jgi:uncharacterized protein
MEERVSGPIAHSTMTMEPATVMRAAGFDWDHEVQVALPPSYGSDPERAYPVLWLIDGPQLLHLAIGIVTSLLYGGLAPEMIIVAVGCPGEAGVAEWGRRRIIDLMPPGETALHDGPGGDFLRRMDIPKMPQQADRFLAFLVDEVRPALAARYRMDGDHGLLGHSAGGMFTSYALFARPGAFRRYIVGSPSCYAVDRAIFGLEADHVRAHGDLAASVFFGAGEQEIGQITMAAMGIVSSPVLLAETLAVRRYPSLKLKTRIFPDKDHFSAIADLVGEGIRFVWADRLDPAQRPPTG